MTSENSTAYLSRFLDEVPKIREAITQTPRGPWKINVTAGYERSIFVNRKRVKLEHVVDFAATRSQMERFFVGARKAADDLESGLEPLREYLEGSVSGLEDSLNPLFEPVSGKSSQQDLKQLAGLALGHLDQVSSALSLYRSLKENDAAAISKIEATLDQAIDQAQSELETYLHDQPAGQKASQTQFEGYKTQIGEAVGSLKTQFIEEIPQILSQAEDALTDIQNLIKKM